MLYLTGIHALNLECGLATCGDWHRSALAWKDLTLRDSEKSVFGEWGIEGAKPIPKHNGLYYVADHLRACLDLVAEGNFALAQGMKDDYICNDSYTPVVFEKTALLRDSAGWASVDAFMQKEYRLDWLGYKKERRL